MKNYNISLSQTKKTFKFGIFSKAKVSKAIMPITAVEFENEEFKEWMNQNVHFEESFRDKNL